MLSPMKDYFTPGEIAARFDLTLDTLRYYEKAGLLRRVDRAPSGHRRYRADDVELLHLVRCLRDTDMPISRPRGKGPARPPGGERPVVGPAPSRVPPIFAIGANVAKARIALLLRFLDACGGYLP